MVTRKRIPELFESIACSGNERNDHDKLIGYIMGYLTILTGQRAMVFINMNKENVINCERWNKDRRYNNNKTVQAFGEAALNLNKEEYCWLAYLCEGKCCQQGEDIKHVFHTKSGKQIQKPMGLLNLAWVDAGMKGAISFNKIRSSVSTQANQHLSEREKACGQSHDPAILCRSTR
ncbi:uncharacterized protein LOC125903812%2C partial [Scomber scombrus]|uniref:Uncharacterized protein LOC125903812, partial n=1 Tax=Scomber scombrus TaxID=13677 RepID=A0AAV1NIC7_SCOSC